METVSRTICSRFSITGRLIKCICALSEQFPEHFPDLSEVSRELSAKIIGVQLRYVLCTSDLFIMADDSEIERRKAIADYEIVVGNNEIVRDISACADEANRCIVSLEKISLQPQRKKRDNAAVSPPAAMQIVGEAKKYYEQYVSMNDRKWMKATTVQEGVKFTTCTDCNTEMKIVPERSVLECPICSKVVKLDGTVFDDTQFYSQEGQKAKSGTFNPNRHHTFWMTHILAEEDEKELESDGCTAGVELAAGTPIPDFYNETAHAAPRSGSSEGDQISSLHVQCIIDRLREMVTDEKKVLRILTVYDVRAMLQKIGRSNLNRNVSLLMKILTGVGPPQLSEASRQKAIKCFVKALEIRERIDVGDRLNRSYYPFYMYKIFDAILTSEEERRVLYYIYLQGEQTLRKNDIEWQKICESGLEADGIAYRPTNRNEALRYRPR